MPTKAQAKTAIDNAVTAIKADIDNLPAGVNIVDAAISFGPTRWELFLSAEGSDVTAEALVTSIKTYLESNNVEFKIARGGRRGIDLGSAVRIITPNRVYIILNFNYPK